jgi:hypothetical protein
MTGRAPIVVHIEEDDDTIKIDSETGTIETTQPDGSVVVQLDAHRPSKDARSGDEWFKNLALEDIPAGKLAIIANDLVDAIEADDRSRQQYLTIRARGIDLLGLKLEEPKSTVGDASSSSEGMSSVTNPLLLEAVLKGWANARAELLPAEGPVKIDNEGDETEAEDDLADTLERDMNVYLTETASEYYPDTSHMLLWGTYFGGSGIKKIYRCPMRRRPVSESVDVKDLIVSNTTKDFRSCGRITHQIEMRPSVMKRMKLLKVYRDVTLTQPKAEPNAIDQKIAGIQGTLPQHDRPEDEPHNLYETQCELDLNEFAPKGFKDEGIPLPFLVTIDKDSREVLAIRRDWEEDDEDANRQRMYVKYPYVPGPGFYGTGMLNILGNSSAAMTAAWREALDAGMYASFPGGLILKLGQRQSTNNFRVGPGEFAGIESNGNMKIGDMVMPMPYRDVTPGLMTMMDKITTQAQQLGSSAEVPVGEGLTNVPVGTMLAAIEQATKVMAAAHKDMCVAMADELGLMIDLFRRHPEDFWRGNKDVKARWDEAKLVQALADYKLIPRADPNTPSHIHRIMKAVALVQLTQNPMLAPHLDPEEILRRVLRAMREDATGLIIPPPPMPAGGPPQDPAKMLQAQAAMKKATTDEQLAAVKAQSAGADATLESAKLQGEKDIALINLQREEVIHNADAAKDQAQSVRDEAQQAREHSLAQSQHGLDALQADREHALNTAKHGLDVAEFQHGAGIAEKETKIAEKVANKPTPKPSGKK